MSGDLKSSTVDLVDARSPTAAEDEVDDSMLIEKESEGTEAGTNSTPATVSSTPDIAEQEKKIEKILMDSNLQKCPDKLLAMYQLCKQLEDTPPQQS